MPETVSHPSEEEQKFSSPLEGALPSEPLTQKGRPHVENGQMKFPSEAANLLSHAMNELRVSKPLAELKEKRPDIYYHTIGVTQKTLALAWINKDLEKLTQKDISVLVEAALLHDTGKLDVDKKILDAPRALKPHERVIMSFHPLHSMSRAGVNFNGDPRTIFLIETHHQIQDNPSMSEELMAEELAKLNLSKEEEGKLRVMGQILEAADKFDAMTDPSRKYRTREMAPEEIEEILFDNFSNHHGDLKFVRQILDLHYPHMHSAESAESSDVSVADQEAEK